MRPNPWNPYVQAGLKRVLPEAVYLRYVGRHELGSMRIWREYARACTDAILDIGAYHGVYALAAREENSRVPIYAFEPSPSSLPVLRQVCEEKNIHIEAFAVAERTGEVGFRIRGQGSQMAEDGPIRVSTISLDEWAKVPVSLLKIDTEGAEAAIFRGARRLLESKPTILCEVLHNEAGEAVMDALPGYRYFRIDEDRGTEERQRITREHWRHKNWLLLPH